MNLSSVFASFIAQLNNIVKVKKQKEGYVLVNSLCIEVLRKLKEMEMVESFEDTGKRKLGMPIYKVEMTALKRTFLSEIKVKSTPGRRLYIGYDDIDKFKGNCFHKAILSTNKGLYSCKECKKEKVGGEMLVVMR